jgi:hypothetical protein
MLEKRKRRTTKEIQEDGGAVLPVTWFGEAEAELLKRAQARAPSHRRRPWRQFILWLCEEATKDDVQM